MARASASGRLADQAERLKALRAHKRVSQQEAANALGVSMRGYAAWEAGEARPQLENLRALAEYFQTTPDYIEYGRDRSRHETPDISETLDIGAEILSRLTRLETDILDRLVTLEEHVRLLRAELAAREAEAIARTAAEDPAKQASPKRQRR